MKKLAVVLSCLVCAATSVTGQINANTLVTSSDDMASFLEETQNQFLLISPPSQDIYIHPIRQAFPVNIWKLDRNIRRKLIGHIEVIDGCMFPVYTVYVYEEVRKTRPKFNGKYWRASKSKKGKKNKYRTPEERVRVIYNDRFWPIAEIKPPEDYNPYAFMLNLFDVDDIQQIDPFYRWIFDPAHIALEIKLIPRIFYPYYLEALERERPNPPEPPEPEPITSLALALNTAATGSDLNVQSPSDFSGLYNILAKPDLLADDWDLVSVGYIADGVTNVIVFEDDPFAPDTRFFQIEPADGGLGFNSDDDGLSDAAEYLIYKSDPENPDTDGDGTDDYDETHADGSASPINDIYRDSDGLLTDINVPDKGDYALPEMEINPPTAAYPPIFSAFNPPVSGQADPSAPEISEWTRQNQPGDTMALTGERLSDTEYNRDVGFLYFSQATTKGGRLSEGLIHRQEGRQCAVTLSTNLPPDDVYLMWPYNINGFGEPVAINAAEAWWIGFDEVAHGGTIRVYGRNLKLGDDVSYLYIQELDQWLESSASNPYMAEFTVPEDVPEGTYTLYLHNGHGRDYGWSDPLSVVVISAYDWAGNSYDFEADFGADGSDEDSDQAAFDAMEEAVGANPGSTVNFPAGTYYASSKVIVKGNTRYIGQGISNTVIQAHSSFAADQPLLTALNPNFEIKEMSFATSTSINDPNGRAFEFNGSKSRDGLFENVEFRDFVDPEVANYGFMAMDNSSRITFRGCTFIMGQGIYLGPCSQVLFDGCTIDGLYDSNQLITLGGFGGKADRTAFINCMVKNYDMSDDSEGFGWCKGRVFVITGSSDGFYMGSTTFDRLQPRDPTSFWTDGVITAWSSLGAETNVANLGVVRPVTFSFVDVPDEFEGRGNNSINWKGVEVYVPVDSDAVTLRGWVKEMDALNDDVTIWIKEKVWPEYDNLAEGVSTNGVFLDIVDNNAGEQILLEGPWPIQAGNILSATPTNIFISPSEAAVQDVNDSTDLFITGGRGLGQARAVDSIDEVSGEIVISDPWRVVPDSTSTYSVGSGIRKVAIYDNVFSGRESGIGDGHVATTSLQINNSHDVVFANNTLTNVRHSLRLYSYQSEAPSMSGRSAPGPNFFAECIDNDITGAAWGFYTTVGISGSNPLVPGESWSLGHIFRKNRVSGITKSVAFEFSDSYSTNNVIGMNVLDRNEVTDLRSVEKDGKVISYGKVLLVDENASDHVLVGNQFDGNENVVGLESENVVLRENLWSGFSQTYAGDIAAPALEVPTRVVVAVADFLEEVVPVWNSGSESMTWVALEASEWLTLATNQTTLGEVIYSNEVSVCSGNVPSENDAGQLTLVISNAPPSGQAPVVILTDEGVRVLTVAVEAENDLVSEAKLIRGRPDGMQLSSDILNWLGDSAIRAALSNQLEEVNFIIPDPDAYFQRKTFPQWQIFFNDVPLLGDSDCLDAWTDYYAQPGTELKSDDMLWEEFWSIETNWVGCLNTTTNNQLYYDGWWRNRVPNNRWRTQTTAQPWPELSAFWASDDWNGLLFWTEWENWDIWVDFVNSGILDSNWKEEWKAFYINRKLELLHERVETWLIE